MYPQRLFLRHHSPSSESRCVCACVAHDTYKGLVFFSSVLSVASHSLFSQTPAICYIVSFWYCPHYSISLSTFPIAIVLPAKKKTYLVTTKKNVRVILWNNFRTRKFWSLEYWLTTLVTPQFWILHQRGLPHFVHDKIPYFPCFSQLQNIIFFPLPLPKKRYTLDFPS